MPSPTIAIPLVAPDEVKRLVELRRSARRVHKSVPAHAPVRRASAELSEYLYWLNRRGVPLKVLARLVGLSHQAVRVRVRSAAEAEKLMATDETVLDKVSCLSEPTDEVALIADAGVHRRLHVFDPPESLGAAHLAMLPEIPLLETREQVAAWLETEEAPLPSGAPVTATSLRVPPAVYLPRGLVDNVLVPLTTED